MKTIYLLLIAAFVLCACGDKNDNPYAGKEMASGPSYCKNFVPAEIERLTKEGSLEATRELRDMYMDCDPGMKYTELALAWAKKAADIGDAEDKRVYQLLSDVRETAPRPIKE